MPLFNFVVTHPAEWPTEIKDMVCLYLTLRSPVNLSTDHAQRSLPELRNSSLPGYIPESDSEKLDIFILEPAPPDTVTVDQVYYAEASIDGDRVSKGLAQSAFHASNNDTKPSTTPLWSLLIRSLVSVCYNKSYITQEAAFVRPRLSYVRSFMEYGHASLLISHTVEDIQRPRSVVNDETSGHLSMMTAERTKNHRKNMMTNPPKSVTSTKVSTDPTSAQSSYVPFDTHILTSWRHPNSVVLPFLCVIDEEAIFSLMGFVGRVVLGWLDKECPDPEVLPAIRFAYGDETRTDALLGVSVKLLQILGLRAHIEGIVAQCPTPTFKRLS
ncbi:hypothetical protein IW262DRAFT_1456509 [Armillaria fumosa]|nr:hypothetical protein IW262DRAFT_1456509 [Armillaria fumosa]